MKVLVALDDSDCSDLAIQFVVDRPWLEEDVFAVISVVDTPPGYSWFGDMPDEAVEMRKESLKKCEEIANHGASRISQAHPDNKVTIKVAEGIVDETICQYAESWGASLIIMGSHGRRGVARLFLGSVAEAVLKNAPCSVEIVKLLKPSKSAETDTSTHSRTAGEKN